jgi:hypothetical protein
MKGSKVEAVKRKCLGVAGWLVVFGLEWSIWLGFMADSWGFFACAGVLNILYPVLDYPFLNGADDCLPIALT